MPEKKTERTPEITEMMLNSDLDIPDDLERFEDEAKRRAKTADDDADEEGTDKTIGSAGKSA